MMRQTYLGKIRRWLVAIIWNWLHIETAQCRGKVILTWIFRNPHVENKKFLGGMK